MKLGWQSRNNSGIKHSAKQHNHSHDSKLFSQCIISSYFK